MEDSGFGTAFLNDVAYLYFKVDRLNQRSAPALLQEVTVKALVYNP